MLLTLLKQNLGPSPTPTPSPPLLVSRSSPVGGGAAWWQREDEQPRDDSLVRVVVSSVDVEVRATILDVQVVERGNLIHFIAEFEGDPDEVHFVHIRPGEHRPVADAGFGHRDSKILRVRRGLYVVVVDTTGFNGGTLRWHFFSRGNFQASDFGEIQIPAREAQLL